PFLLKLTSAFCASCVLGVAPFLLKLISAFLAPITCAIQPVESPRNRSMERSDIPSLRKLRICRRSRSRSAATRLGMEVSPGPPAHRQRDACDPGAIDQ